MKKTVLLLSTYPFSRPRHGGQVRTANIAKTYADAGWMVENIAVFEEESYDESQIGPRDIPFPASSPYRQFKGRSIPLINDLLSGIYAAAEDGGFPDIVKNLRPSIDAIHVEQPWLWPVAKRIRQIPQYRRAHLIYGSQNVEAPLKEEIFASYNIQSAHDVLHEISALERRAAVESDVCAAVTIADLQQLTKWGGKNPVLAPNGIAPWHAREEVLFKWRERLPKAPWILYVASAHPPNFSAFTALVGDSLGCIPPDSRLVVAGSVSEHIYRQLAQTRWHALNLSRLELLFSLDDEDLSAVKSLAHCFLLPIPHGGGSNIKTAEALFSGAYVVGSATAFRGFEPFLELPEVIVANRPTEFHAAIRGQLTRAPSATEQGFGIRHSLRWSRCLARIPEAVLALEPQGQARSRI